MTAPVTQQGDGNSWTVHFVMPSNYTMETLPKPNNPAVTLKEIPGKRFAVIRFSGTAGEDSLKRHTKELDDFISAKNLKAAIGPHLRFLQPALDAAFPAPQRSPGRGFSKLGEHL